MRILTNNGIPLAHNGVLLTDPDLADVVEWDHSYDARDTNSYFDEGTFDLDPATRAAACTDRHSDGEPQCDAIKDTGDYSTLLSLPDLIPGPLYLPSSSRFNGRPCWLSDAYDEGIFHHTLLAPFPAAEDPGFDQPHPYWGIVLGRMPNDITEPGGILDGEPGSPTIYWDGEGDGTVNISCWNSFPGDPGPYINSVESITRNNTFLLAYAVDGEDSSLNLYFRNSAGLLISDIQTGELGGGANGLKDFHIGLLYSSYISALAFKYGTQDPSDLAAVVGWAARYIPPEAVISDVMG